MSGATIDIGGLQVPDAGPVFLGALALHVLAGAMSVVAGLGAAAARKGPGRHQVAGRVYLVGITVVFATATVMAAVRWREDRHLFVIAILAFGLAMTGWWVRRRHPKRWVAWHAVAMAASYIALFTGFYVDNGPQLPVWDRLPHLLYWIVPAAVGVPLTWRAIVRNGAVRGRIPSPGRPGTPRPGRARVAAVAVTAATARATRSGMRPRGDR